MGPPTELEQTMDYKWVELRFKLIFVADTDV